VSASLAEGFDTGTTWRPDQDHPKSITGTLKDVRTVAGSYGSYPLVELEDDATNVLWLVHAFRDVLQSELASCAPAVGDRITISFGGKHERGYYLYRVRRADGKARTIDWTRFGGDTPVEPDAPVEPDVPIAPVERPAEPSVAERAAEGSDDDVPF
jgi:hypothetical protein